jgi:alanyl-tRNA synthetase
LNKHVQEIKDAGLNTLDGTTAFKMYDTFGFPWELTLEILQEQGLEGDKVGFDAAMLQQRERARAARQDNEEKQILPDLSGLVSDLKYDECASAGEIVLLLKDGQVVEAAVDGDEVAVILSVTPFYAEGGGQLGDTGFIVGQVGRLTVNGTKKLPDGTIYHVGQVTEGVLKPGETVELTVNLPRRIATARNHTATHLLHAALKQVLGSHVNQAGSQVGPERLRFDFSHFAPVSDSELAEVEATVNKVILESIAIGIITTTQELARAMGAMALFGEKYGDKVRVVMAGDFSKELCGGSHVGNTSEIGLFKIVSESGIGAGLRRIEALTGAGALDYINSRENILAAAAAALKTRPEDLLTRIEGFAVELKDVEQQLAGANAKLAKFAVQDLLAGTQTEGEVQLVIGEVNAADMDDLRGIADMVRDRLSCGVVVLAAVGGDKVNFVAMATANAVAKGIHAGNIVKAAATIAGGGGGGRPDMAQAGGKQPAKTAEALSKALEIAKGQVKL